MFFVTTPTMAKTMFAIMVTFFALSLVTMSPFLIFYGVLGVVLAGYILGDTLEKNRARR